MSNFKFKMAEEKTALLIININKFFETLNDEKIFSIIEEFNTKLSEVQKKLKLEIAFVGQYSAGKSTIISCLTGNKEINIGQDITTDKVNLYPWDKVLLVDTPGIHAGRPDHDKISLEYMNNADLLVYVITTQGFSSEVAKDFKKIAFEENRFNKMMLVINKSSQGNKNISLNNWIFDALKVTEPKTADDLYLSVIDSKDFLESLKIDNVVDREELVKYSGFNDFIKNLDSFIFDKRILGRLTTPLNLIEAYLNKVINQLTAGNEDTINLLELLDRKQFRLTESKKNITETVNGHIDKLVSNIKKEANKIANLIEKDGSKDILDSEYKNSIDYLKNSVDDTNKVIETSIENEFSSLQYELDILMKSELAQTLLNQESIKVTFNTDIEIKTFDKTKLESSVDILNNMSRFAEGFAVNKKAADLGLEGLKKAAGSDAHKVVYNVGKFFGHNFKPYEAVKYADKISKIGSLFGKIAIALPFLVAGYEVYAENKYEIKIKEERQKVRQSYDEIANHIKTSFQEQFILFLKESYDIELNNNTKIIKGIRDSKKQNITEVKIIEDLLCETNNILEILN